MITSKGFKVEALTGSIRRSLIRGLDMLRRRGARIQKLPPLALRPVPHLAPPPSLLLHITLPLGLKRPVGTPLTLVAGCRRNSFFEPGVGRGEDTFGV